MLFAMMFRLFLILQGDNWKLGTLEAGLENCNLTRMRLLGQQERGAQKQPESGRRPPRREEGRASEEGRRLGLRGGGPT